MRILRISHLYYQHSLNKVEQFASNQVNYSDLCNFISYNNYVGLSDFNMELTRRKIVNLEVFYDSLVSQNKWLEENGFERLTDSFKILCVQIEIFKPDIIFVTSSHLFGSDELLEIKSKFKRVSLFIAHKGTPFGYNNLKHYDIVYVATPLMVDEARAYHSNIRLFYHYFSGTPFFQNERAYKCIFPGSSGYKWGLNHSSRYWYLYNLIKKDLITTFLSESYGFWDVVQFTLSFYAYWLCNKNVFLEYQDLEFEEKVRATSPYYPLSFVFGRKINSAVFGEFNTRAIRNSISVFHKHTDDARGYAGAMRLFEVTGNGALLVTDYCNNIYDLFPEDSVLVYKNFQELLDKIKFINSEPKKALHMAKRGFEHCRQYHTIRNRIDIFLTDVAEY